MEVMRKFIIDLKPNGTMKWAEVCDEPSSEVCDEPSSEVQVYKRIISYCESMVYLESGNSDKVAAYQKVIYMCRKQLGTLW